MQKPWQLYATLGMLVGGGSVCLGYTGQGLFLPNWFVRRRGLAMSLAFAVSAWAPSSCCNGSKA